MSRRSGEMQEQSLGSRSYNGNEEMAKFKSRSGVTTRGARCGYCSFVCEEAFWPGGTEAVRMHSAFRVIDVSTTMGIGVAALTQPTRSKEIKEIIPPRGL